MKNPLSRILANIRAMDDEIKNEILREQNRCIRRIKVVNMSYGPHVIELVSN